jgi:hypothetical protein
METDAGDWDNGNCLGTVICGVILCFFVSIQNAWPYIKFSNPVSSGVSLRLCMESRNCPGTASACVHLRVCIIINVHFYHTLNFPFMCSWNVWNPTFCMNSGIVYGRASASIAFSTTHQISTLDSWKLCFGMIIHQISRVFTKNIKESLFYNVPENLASIDDIFSVRESKIGIINVGRSGL